MKGRIPPAPHETDKPLTHALVSRDFDDRALLVTEIAPDGDVRRVTLAFLDIITGRHDQQITVALDTLRRVLSAIKHRENVDPSPFWIDPSAGE